MPGVVIVEVIGAGEGINVTEEQLHELIYEEDIWGASRFLLHVETLDDGPWTDLLQDPEKRFKIRLKHVDDDGSSESATKVVRYSHGRIRNLGDSPELIIEGYDAGWDLYEGYKQGSVYKGKRVSEIVEEIAARRSLKTDVTETMGKHNLWQCTYPDGYFILYCLLPRAYTENRSDFLFYIKGGNTLVFKPPDLDRDAAIFSVPPSGPKGEGFFNVEEHEFDLRDGKLTSMRTLSTQVRGYDPIKKEYIEFTADDNTVEYRRLGRTKVHPTQEPTRVVLVTEPHGPEYDKRNVRRFGEAVWSRNLRIRYEVRLMVKGFLKVAPGDTFRIDNSHWMGGRYLCSGVRQWMDSNSLDLWTAIYGIRRTHN